MSQVSRIVGRVVVGVSGSPESLHALRHAVELARQYEALLIAVNAQPVGGRESAVWQHAASLVIRDAFEEGLGGLPRDVECMLLAAPGEPGPALLSVADRPNDVLVLGSARTGGYRFDEADGCDGSADSEDSDVGSAAGESLARHRQSSDKQQLAAADGDAPARRQLIPALWRRHVRPLTGDSDGLLGPRIGAGRSAADSVAAYCLGHAVCAVLSVPPPPLAVSARAFPLPR